MYIYVKYIYARFRVCPSLLKEVPEGRRIYLVYIIFWSHTKKQHIQERKTFYIYMEFMKLRIFWPPWWGKSTLAKKLSQQYNTALLCRDDVLYEQKFTKQRPKEERIKLINEFIQDNEHRIFEWATSSNSYNKELLKDADHIIYCKPPIRKLFYRILKRELTSKPIQPIKNIYRLLSYARNYEKEQSNTKELLNNPNLIVRNTKQPFAL